MNSLKALHEYGQSPWLDFMRRTLIGAELQTMIERDGLGGITSNPSIFEKAIGQSSDYDSAVAAILGKSDVSAPDLYERLAIEDIQLAADSLLPVYRTSAARDGYVSLEVSPYLANDTDGTLDEARRLWADVSRPNLMVKVPATPAGIPAIRQLISEGININVTLLFGIPAYEAVAEAYISGLEARAGDLSTIGSVASFFVSRIDAVVDAEIAKSVADPGLAEERKALLGALAGKIAIANARLAYQSGRKMFSGPRWQALEARGARVQRLLWASTGTKNPAYSDVLYVEELIGTNTVNTMPPATMDAFRDHGTAAARVENDVAGAAQALASLSAFGISLEAITDKLLVEGVRSFADSFDTLLAAVENKRRRVLGERIGALTSHLPQDLADAAAKIADGWRRHGSVRALWRRDSTLWTNSGEARWLGWLDSTETALAGIEPYLALARDVAAAGFTDVVLLGMGGSSLGPEMLAAIQAASAKRRFHIVDSTDPTQILAAEAGIDLASTLFIVASKSGSTLEVDVLRRYFFARATERFGIDEAGTHFIAITDPGSQLEKTARADKYRALFQGNPEIGGRYSVLSPFGFAVAAAIGIDLERLLQETQLMVRSCGALVPPAANAGATLGALLAAAAQAGRDKLTLLNGPGMGGFGAWIEQLVAESSGKNGKAIIPVDGEPVGVPAAYGNDRLFVHLTFKGRIDPDGAKIDALAAAGHPIIRIEISDSYQIGQEICRWEIATAMACATIGVNPFDQPDVEASKLVTKALMSSFIETGHLPEEPPFLKAKGIRLHADSLNRASLDASGADVPTVLGTHFRRHAAGDYIAILAYIPRNDATLAALARMRAVLRDATGLAIAAGFGPRFLHSSGQAYKGGPNTGLFLQITCENASDPDIPGLPYSFGLVKTAQAAGDLKVLAERGRRALRIHLTGDLTTGLDALTEAIVAGLSDNTRQ